MLKYLIDFAKSFWNQAKLFAAWILDSILDIFSEIFFYIMDAFFTLIETVISSINFAEITVLNAFSSWDLLPPQVIWLLNRLNLAQCLTILAAAYLIRLTLNLIPSVFTRV